MVAPWNLTISQCSLGLQINISTTYQKMKNMSLGCVRLSSYKFSDLCSLDFSSHHQQTNTWAQHLSFINIDFQFRMKKYKSAGKKILNKDR